MLAQDGGPDLLGGVVDGAPIDAQPFVGAQMAASQQSSGLAQALFSCPDIFRRFVRS